MTKRTCVAILALALTACATLQQLAALRQVDFAIDRVANAQLAGVSLERIRNYQDLSASETARLALAIANGEMPFAFNLHLSALNPADNSVTARLVQLDWMLLLDDRETISGRTDREILLEPGRVEDIPIAISLDLVDFFQHNARDFFNLAQAIAGQGGQPTRIALRATPTVQTALGPITYPEPITIVSREIGGTRTP